MAAAFEAPAFEPLAFDVLALDDVLALEDVPALEVLAFDVLALSAAVVLDEAADFLAVVFLAVPLPDAACFAFVDVDFFPPTSFGAVRDFSRVTFASRSVRPRRPGPPWPP